MMLLHKWAYLTWLIGTKATQLRMTTDDISLVLVYTAASGTVQARKQEEIFQIIPSLISLCMTTKMFSVMNIGSSFEL